MISRAADDRVKDFIIVEDLNRRWGEIVDEQELKKKRELKESDTHCSVVRGSIG